MISKLGRVQLLVFVLVAVVAVTYAAAEYVNCRRTGSRVGRGTT